MDCIIIEQLEFQTIIGCLDWERQILQSLSLDLQIDVDLKPASQSDQLEDTINYAQICQLSIEVIQQAQPQLLEHAAYLVLNCLFEKFPSITKVNIHIRKPAIIAQAKAVGIRLIRERHDFCHCSI